MGSGTRKRKGASELALPKTRSMKGGKPGGGTATLDAESDAQIDSEFKGESEELERSGRTLTRVLLFVFGGVAVLMLVVAVLTGVSTGRRLAREQSVVGQVTAMTERKDSDGNSSYYPAVAFDVPDGGRYNVQTAEGNWPPEHRVGDLVTVLYDSQNPMKARIASSGGTFALWTWTLVTGILAVGFALAAALAWALGR